MKNLSSELQIFTDVEMTTLETLIEETEVSWCISLFLFPLPGSSRGGNTTCMFLALVLFYVYLRNSREGKSLCYM
jgi:hypothetical protein